MVLIVSSDSCSDVGHSGSAAGSPAGGTRVEAGRVFSMVPSDEQLGSVLKQATGGDSHTPPDASSNTGKTQLFSVVLLSLFWLIRVQRDRDHILTVPS